MKGILRQRDSYESSAEAATREIHRRIQNILVNTLYSVVFDLSILYNVSQNDRKRGAAKRPPFHQSWILNSPFFGDDPDHDGCQQDNPGHDWHGDGEFPNASGVLGLILGFGYRLGASWTTGMSASPASKPNLLARNYRFLVTDRVPPLRLETRENLTSSPFACPPFTVKVKEFLLLDKIKRVERFYLDY